MENSREYSPAPALPDELVRISDFRGPGTYDAFWSLSHDPAILPELEGQSLAVSTPDEFQFVAAASSPLRIQALFSPSLCGSTTTISKPVRSPGVLPVELDLPARPAVQSQ